MLMQFLEYYTQDYNESIIEKICRFIKHTMRCIQKDFTPFLESYLTQVVKLYKERQIPTYLYAVEVTITVFYKYPDNELLIQNSFNELCQTTFLNFKTIQEYENLPDIIDDFFGMHYRIIKFNQKIFFQSQLLQHIFEFALEGIGIQHT